MASSADSRDDTNTDDVKVVDHNNVKSDEEHETTNQTETPGKKGRGRGRGTKRKSEADMIAEAKAVFGELNQTEGRQLRKRAEPPKVEKKAAPARKGTPRKSSTPASKQDKPDTVESDEKTQDDAEDEKVAAETENEPDKEEADASLSNGNGVTDDVAPKLESHEESASKASDTMSAESSEQSKGTSD